MGENTGKNISNKLSKNSINIARNILIILNKLEQMLLKLLKKDQFNSENSRSIGDFIGNKIANKITKFSKNSPQNNSETFTNENDKEIPKERYISPE